MKTRNLTALIIKFLNEPVYRLTRKNLNAVYADNKVLLEKIKLSKKKEWTIKNEQIESLLLNEIFYTDKFNSPL